MLYEVITDLWALKDLAEEVFKRRLEQIDGVAQAAVAGGLEREIHVEINPRFLDSYGITVQQVIDALDAANQSAPGGTIRRGRYRYALRTIGEFQAVDDVITSYSIHYTKLYDECVGLSRHRHA